MRVFLLIILMFQLYCTSIIYADDDNDYKSIFNGKDLTGWKTFVDPKADQGSIPEDQWYVEDGLLKCKAGPRGYLATDAKYKNFIVQFQYRFGENSIRKGNFYSSMFVRVTGPDRIWPKGVDVTLGAGKAGQIWLLEGFKLTIDPKRQNPKQARNFAAIKANADKPRGEWNECKIQCLDGSIKAWINGHLVNEGTEADVVSGRLILLSEGSDIYFLKIEAKEISREP